MVDKQNSSSMNVIKNETDILEYLSDLPHPGVVRKHHIREFDNFYILALDLAKGGSLEKLLRQISKEEVLLSEEQMASIIKNILLALQHLHSNGVIHRDLKPANILFKDAGDYSSVVIVDFGLS